MTDHDPLIPEPPFELGEGRYLAMSRVAEGGSSVTFLALDRGGASRCFVHLLRPELLPEGHLAGLLRAQSSVVAALRHPHMLRIRAAGSDGPLLWFVTDMASRGSIDDWVAANGPLPDTAAVDVVVQVSAALEHAHEQGIVHGDLSAASVLVDDDGLCRVADFGTARLVVRKNLRLAAALGVVGYLAPEQMDPTKPQDLRVDVFAVGALLYCVLTGRVPLDLHLLRPGDPRLVGLHPALQHVILRSTRFKREHRYASLAELKVDLQSALLHLPMPLERHPLLRTDKATPPPVPPRLGVASVAPKPPTPVPVQRTARPSPPRSEGATPPPAPTAAAPTTARPTTGTTPPPAAPRPSRPAWSPQPPTTDPGLANAPTVLLDPPDRSGWRRPTPYGPSPSAHPTDPDTEE